MFAQITKWFRKLLPRNGDQHIGAHPMFRPTRDWLVIVVVFVGVTVAIAAAAWYMFVQVEEGSFFASTSAREEASDVRLQKNELTNVIEYYEQKRRRFNQFSEGSLSTFDPSL